MTTPQAISADPTPEAEGELDFYVSVMDGPRFGLLLGPFPTHAEAKANVDKGTKLANDANAWAAFYAFGTASLPRGTPARVVFA